jgi:D-glycero-alpha-D-manno-heptose-7-phosphate kinase
VNSSHPPTPAFEGLAPTQIIYASAPIRICDNGGWTDTWFAGYGKVFNIGVYPSAEVQVTVYPTPAGEQRIIIYAENYGERYLVNQDQPWEKHPLLEASIETMGIPPEISFEANIYSQAPGGASTGTSAAVTVALVGALDRLTSGRMTPHEVAQTAHRVETELLHQQSGIQDQLCSAYGGVNFIEMQQYPYATVSQIQVPNEAWWELERRLVLIFLGKTHHSSKVHEMVIASLEQDGPDNPGLNALRQAAVLSRDALYNADFQALGRAMAANTEAQAQLHPALISPDAQRVIEVAQAYGAIGWKVNGAGGEGGSLTILCNEHSQARRAMIAAIEQENSLYRNIPIYLSRHGLRVWQQPQLP